MNNGGKGLGENKGPVGCEGAEFRFILVVDNQLQAYYVKLYESYQTHNPFTGHSRDCDGADINNGSSHSSFVLRHALRVLPTVGYSSTK